jgi:polyisoprenyl-teichoic acid--peptidoglycan teichoic acid transferase
MRRRKRRGCLVWLLLLTILLSIPLAVYLLLPMRTNVLLLGIDRNEDAPTVARTDTMILTTFLPFQPYVGMLSIPRDLWVALPTGGENRINTAHFFAEAQQRGAGPEAAMQTVRQNFGVDVHYYARARFGGLRDVVEAMGGLRVVLTEDLPGYPAGEYQWNGDEALRFVRHRTGSDDFFRMQNGQIALRSMLAQMLRPTSWLRFPAILAAAAGSVDTDVPIWLWPRLGFALLRTGPDGIDSRSIDRSMVAPFITADGANVLIPNWLEINPILFEIFGQ